MVLVNYVFPRYLLAEWWVGGFLPTLLVRSFAPSPLRSRPKLLPGNKGE